MSRKIKFRAYQKTSSLNHKPNLYEVTGLDFYEGDYGGGEVCLRNKKGEQWTEYIKDVVLEQFTGLLDRNGKEIYEGDIITETIDDGSNKIIQIYEVYWDEDMLNFGIRGTKGFNYNLHDELWQTNASREVIGNIHENPELLDI